MRQSNRASGQGTRRAEPLFPRSLLIWGIVVFVAACGSGGGGGGGRTKNGGGPAAQSLTLGGISITTADAGAVLGAVHVSTTFLPTVDLFATNADADVGIVLHDVVPDITTAPMSYELVPLGFVDAVGQAEIIVNFDLPSAAVCIADTGTLDVTAFGAAGGKVTGNLNVSAWHSSSTGPCPTPPVAGAFQLVRYEDDSAGNDGSETDTISLTRANPNAEFPPDSGFTERATVRYDPLLFVTAIDAASAHVTIQAGANLATLDHDREILISIFGSPSPNASYSLDTFDASFSETNNASGDVCFGDTGTISLDATSSPDGTAGSQLVINLNVTSVFGAVNCPTAYAGTVTVTIDED